MNDLISIIIPVYNCEKFLEDCFTSLLSQTYTNFEAIIVVNGCTDGSEKICRDYEKKDSRFTVITSDEADVSVARNIGIDNANGKYITFLDSDDFVTDNFLSTLYDMITTNDADVAICEYLNVDEDCHSYSNDNFGYSVSVMTNNQIMDLFFTTNKTSLVTVWNKLYKKELWTDIKYPAHRKNEDEYVSYKILYNAATIVTTSAALYLYRQRSGSIMHVSDGNRYCDCINAYCERTDYFYDKKEIDYAIYSCISTLKWCTIFYYNICSSDSFSTNVLKKHFNEALRFLTKHDTNPIVADIPSDVMNFYKAFANSPVDAHKLYLDLEYKKYKKDNSSSTVFINSLRKIKNEFRYNVKKNLLFLNIKLKNNIHIINTEQSIDAVINEDKGLCRFGDGELDLIRGRRIGFQKSDERLARRLLEILADENAPCHIAVPDEINLIDFNNQTMKSRRYWIWNMIHCRSLWIAHCNPSITYLTTNITRPYMRYFDKSVSINYFNKLRTLWDDKDILIVEGEKSRLGIGNNLFDKSRIKRILCPNTDAFDYYDEILDEVIKQPKEIPVFIALGPTATVLAYDLCKIGYKAYDIGHVDIEYEWMNLKTDTKVAIPSKFTNEADGGNRVDDCRDSLYLSQIIAKLGPTD